MKRHHKMLVLLGLAVANYGQSVWYFTSRNFTVAAAGGLLTILSIGLAGWYSQ